MVVTADDEVTVGVYVGVQGGALVLAVGEIDGTMVIVWVGNVFAGNIVGHFDGLPVRFTVGLIVGVNMGLKVGVIDGSSLGSGDGSKDEVEGTSVGNTLGMKLGLLDLRTVGFVVDFVGLKVIGL